MTITIKIVYLSEIRRRYRNGSKSEKTKILDEFCLFCQNDRKHTIKILRGNEQPRKRRPGPTSKFGHPDFVAVLKDLWENMNKMCSKKMVAAFPK